MRCDDCGCLLALEVEHLCHACCGGHKEEDGTPENMLLCGACAHEQKKDGHDCRPLRD